MKISITLEPIGVAIWELEPDLRLLQTIRGGSILDARRWVVDVFRLSPDRVLAVTSTLGGRNG